ncbi:hypothetical protein ACFX13_043021 [Malus domestica]
MEGMRKLCWFTLAFPSLFLLAALSEADAKPVSRKEKYHVLWSNTGLRVPKDHVLLSYHIQDDSQWEKVNLRYV